MAYTPQTPLEAWTFLILISTAAGILCDFLVRSTMKVWDMRRRWIITVPSVVGGLATIDRRVVKDGKVIQKKGEEGTYTLLSGDAFYPSNRGPIHLISSEGWNLVSPTPDEPGEEARTGEEIKANPAKWKRLRIWDTLTMWRAARENDMEDLYSSNKEKPHWLVQVAPIAFVALLLAMGAIVFLGYQILKAQGQG